MKCSTFQLLEIAEQPVGSKEAKRRKKIAGKYTQTLTKLVISGDKYSVLFTFKQGRI